MVEGAVNILWVKSFPIEFYGCTEFYSVPSSNLGSPIFTVIVFHTLFAVGLGTMYQILTKKDIIEIEDFIRRKERGELELLSFGKAIKEWLLKVRQALNTLKS